MAIPAPLRQRWQLILAAITVVIGAILRLWQYASVPAPSDNPDEVQFGWAGMSLLATGVPRSWSYFPEYHRFVPFHFHDGVTYPLVQPWIDHPPLFSAVVGLALALVGQHQFDDLTTWAVRLPSIALSILTIPLVYQYARGIGGQAVAAVAGLLFAIAPGAVLYSRAVEPEAVLAPLLLVALIACRRLVARPSAGWLALLMGATALAPLAKVTGLAVGLTAVVILLLHERPSLAAAAAASALLGLGLVALFGAIEDWSLFVGVSAEQAAHRVGVMGAFDFITSPAGLNRHFRDPWWLLGWLGIAFALSRTTGNRLGLYAAAPLLVYAATILFLADNRVAAFGWYRIAVYPPAYVLAALVLVTAAERREFLTAMLVLITGGAAAAEAWLSGAQVAGVAVATVAAVVGTAVAVALLVGRSRPVFGTAAAAAVGLVIVVGSVWIDLHLGDLYLKL